MYLYIKYPVIILLLLDGHTFLYLNCLSVMIYTTQKVVYNKLKPMIHINIDLTDYMTFYNLIH